MLRTNADTLFAFPDLSALKQANDELNQGASFRSVVRTLMAQRQGQLVFDFRLMRLRQECSSSAGRHRQLRLLTAETPSWSTIPTRPSATFVRRRFWTMAMTRNRRKPRKRIEERSSSISSLAAALINLANIHYSRDELSEAQALYERAIGLDSGFLRGPFQPRQHLPRPRTIQRRAVLLSGSVCASIRSTPTRTSTWP